MERELVQDVEVGVVLLTDESAELLLVDAPTPSQRGQGTYERSPRGSTATPASWSIFIPSVKGMMTGCSG